MTDSRITIVNEQDEVIDYRDRAAIVPNDIYRVALLWVTNNQGQVLLARRAYTKSHDPGKWGPAVVGTVEEGDTYESNIVKGAMEELGITGVEFQAGKQYLRRGEKWSYFVQPFSVVLDWLIERFTLRPEEVAEIRWFTKVELAQELAQHHDEFLKSMHIRLQEFISS